MYRLHKKCIFLVRYKCIFHCNATTLAPEYSYFDGKSKVIFQKNAFKRVCVSIHDWSILTPCPWDLWLFLPWSSLANVCRYTHFCSHLPSLLFLFVYLAIHFIWSELYTSSSAGQASLPAISLVPREGKKGSMKYWMMIPKKPYKFFCQS